MSEARSCIPAGIPSRMPTRAGPCDSPAVKKRSTPDPSRTSLGRVSREMERETRLDGDYPRPFATLSTPVPDHEKLSGEASSSLQVAEPKRRRWLTGSRSGRSAARDPGGKARRPDDRAE